MQMCRKLNKFKVKPKVTSIDPNVDEPRQVQGLKFASLVLHWSHEANIIEIFQKLPLLVSYISLVGSAQS